MKLLFLTSDKQRFKQFQYLIPFKALHIALPYAGRGRSTCICTTDVTFLDKISAYGECMVVVDHESLEIACLNGFPRWNITELRRVGLGNVSMITSVKGRGAVHKTKLQVIVSVSLVESLVLEGEVRGEVAECCSKAAFRSFEDVFIPYNYEKPFGEMSLHDKAAVNSLGIATKKFIDLVSQREYIGKLERCE